MSKSDRTLKLGAPRLLGLHLGREGKSYGRHYEALAKEYGLPEPGSLFCLRMGQAAAAWTRFEAASRALAQAVRSDAPRRRLEGQRVMAEQDMNAALDRLAELATALSTTSKVNAAPAGSPGRLRWSRR